MVWAGRWTTILPWSGRPTDCPPGSICRYGARYDEACNCRYFKTNNESNDEATNFRDNCWNEFRNRKRFRLRSRSRLSLRHRSLFR
jgi:hypothetical protein